MQAVTASTWAGVIVFHVRGTANEGCSLARALIYQRLCASSSRVGSQLGCSHHYQFGVAAPKWRGRGCVTFLAPIKSAPRGCCPQQQAGRLRGSPSL